MLSPFLALTLAAPVEVFEEWSLTDTAPLTEVVTARALYHRRAGDTVLLPSCVRRGRRPVVFALGWSLPLTVTWGPHGWQSRLPPGSSHTVRLIARVTRPVEAPRLFRIQWPSIPPADTPTRRLVVVPRDRLAPRHPGWTCPEEPPLDVPCVSHALHPGALVTRVPPSRSPPGTLPLAGTLTMSCFILAARFGVRRTERLFAALGGLAVALATALSLVGARAASWGGATALCLPVGVLVGALAPSTATGRVVGAAALVVLPFSSVLGAPAAPVAALACLAASVIVGAYLVRA